MAALNSSKQEQAKKMEGMPSYTRPKQNDDNTCRSKQQRMNGYSQNERKPKPQRLEITSNNLDHDCLCDRPAAVAATSELETLAD